jgi:acetone carboxylase gamma subunit
MNERILELARQVWPDPNISHVNHMKFAELIVRECMIVVSKKCASPTAYNALVEHFGVEE